MLGQNHPGASERENLYVLSAKPQLFIHTDNPLVTNITSAHAYKPTTFLLVWAQTQTLEPKVKSSDRLLPTPTATEQEGGPHWPEHV